MPDALNTMLIFPVSKTVDRAKEMIYPGLLNRLRQQMISEYAGSGYSLVRHCNEVGEITEQIARTYYAGYDNVDTIAQLAYMAGSLHDYGKIAIPTNIRHSNHRYSHQEKLVMEFHTVFGKHLLEGEGCPTEVVEAAFYHHLHYGGGGYPNCDIDGTAIPLIARMVAVADQFSARVENRLHRPGQPAPEVWSDMKTQRGLVFDPAVLDAFEETPFLNCALAQGAFPISA